MIPSVSTITVLALWIWIMLPFIMPFTIRSSTRQIYKHSKEENIAVIEPQSKSNAQPKSWMCCTKEKCTVLVGISDHFFL